MKVKLKWLLQDVEFDGTPEECAAFFKALQKDALAPAPPSLWLLDSCPMGGSHEYQPVYGWQNQACKKCGQYPSWQMPLLGTFQYQDDHATPNPMPPCRTEIVLRSQQTPPAELVAQLEGLQAPLGCTD